MKTQKEFEDFVDSELGAELNTINKQRKGTVNMFIISLIVCLAFVGFMVYSSMNGASIFESSDTLIIIAVGFIALYGISFTVIHFIKRSKRNGTPTTSSGYGYAFDFKDKVVRRMVEFLDPSFKYQTSNHIKLSEILESGMLQKQNGYQIFGSDMVQGVEDGVPFKFSDVQIVREKKYVGKNEEPVESVLSGSMFIAEFNKTFTHPVYVYSKKTFGGMDSLRYAGDKVRLEDPDFDKLFNVYGEDQIEARYILTPSMMERLKSLRQRLGSNVYIVFSNNSIYIANNNGKDRFEIGMLTSVSKRENVIGYYNDLAEQLGIIDELKLNLNIWKA